MRFEPATAAIALVVVLATAGCDGANDSSPDAQAGSGTEFRTATRDASEVAERCDWSNGRRRAIAEERVRETFVDATDGEDLGLLLEATELEAGQTIRISPLSRAKSIQYGAGASLVDPETGDPLGPLRAVPSIGLSSRRGEAGPCVLLEIPRGIAPGEYEAVVDIGLRASRPVSARVRVIPTRRSLLGRYVATKLVRDGQETDFAEGTELEVEFLDEGDEDSVAWDADCNAHGQAIAIESGRIQAVPGASATEVRCSAEKEAQDAFLRRFFSSGPSWTRDGDELVLESSDAVITFIRR